MARKTTRKQKSYFLVLLKNPEVLFASWKIDPGEVPESISKKLTNNTGLVIEAYSTAKDSGTKIDSIPVHGMENNWHIFTGKEYQGKRVVFTLCHRSPKGKITGLLTSKEIDIPLPGIKTGTRGKPAAETLYILSRINLAGYTGPGKSSSW